MRIVVKKTVRLGLAVSFIAASLYAQDDDFKVYTEAPRLLLTRQRLRLLQRERERKSMRWEQFDTLILSGAPMPEPGFAYALYYKVAGSQEIGKQAVDWALSDKGSDLRQLAFVFDWCAPIVTKAQADRLTEKIELILKSGAKADDVRGQTARALAAIALSENSADHGEAVLKPLIEQWWRDGVIKKIKAGQYGIPRDQVYALQELFHAVRDNLKIDLRGDAGEYFKDLPVDHLVSHYPAPLMTRENEFRVPVYVRDGEPAVIDSVLSRAAEFAMVAFDSNAPETQYLQGWLMQDRFLMRNALGAPYEFLWANPYQPGLSYFQVPLVYHDPTTGHVFARTSWDEDATWLGFFDGHLQMFRDGQIQTLKSGTATEPVHVGDAVMLSAQSAENFRFQADAEAIFVLNLKPHSMYDVEVDDQELSEEETDVGGTMVLALPEGINAGVRIKRRAQ